MQEGDFHSLYNVVSFVCHFGGTNFVYHEFDLSQVMPGYAYLSLTEYNNEPSSLKVIFVAT